MKLIFRYKHNCRLVSGFICTLITLLLWSSCEPAMAKVEERSTMGSILMAPIDMGKKTGQWVWGTVKAPYDWVFAEEDEGGLADGEQETTYRMEKQDKEAEQKKFVVKLLDDKKKVDLAIKSTKALIDRSRTRPYLPELYIRLAELYIEKARIVFFLRKNQAKSKVKALDNLEANSLKNQAIEVYHRILSHFPDYEDRDKVRFYLAHEYREQGEIDKMVVQYRAIIKEHKESQYVPESYLLLGDYFFNSKQDLEMARRHYEHVLAYPDSSAIVVARYKFDWVHINNADHEKAIKILEKAVVAQPRNDLDVDTYSAKINIRLEALVDMAFCYTEAHKKKSPSEAIAYFQRYSWSRPVYLKVLEKLGYRYLIKRKYEHSLAIYRQLSILQHDPEKLLEYSRNIFECVQALKDFDDADKDIASIITALRKQKYSVHVKEEEKEKNILDYEIYARDILTHTHQRARNEKKKDLFTRAADAYKIYLDFFENSPVRDDMEANYAEALFASNDYLKAGKQYEKLATLTPPPNSQKKQHLYSAVLSYYTALKKQDDLSYFQTVYARGGIRDTGQEYVASFPDSTKVPEILFNIAWVTYDQGKYEEAIAEFKDFIKKYPQGKEAKVAAHLILDAYNLREDYKGLVSFGRASLKEPWVDAKLKKEIEAIVQASEGKLISGVTVAALDDWDKGRADLMTFAEENKDSGMGEQALNALIISSRDKGDLDILFDAGERMLTLYPKSDNVEPTLNLMIDAALNGSQFRLMADYLENFVNRYPTHRNSGPFWAQIARIRSGLGEYDKANYAYGKVLKIGYQGDEDRDAMVFNMAQNAVDNNEPGIAIEILHNGRSSLSPLGKVKADAMLGNFYFQEKQLKNAAKYRRRAQKNFKPKFARKDPAIAELMARLAFDTIESSHRKYMDLQLGKNISNKVVSNKAGQLDKLENRYQTVIQYQSPVWALRSCYRLYEINEEFGRFLKNSPIPAELAEEQKAQYVQLISQRAQGYLDKAAQFKDTCIKQAHKWELMTPELTQFYAENSVQYGFSATSFSKEIRQQALADEDLKKLHYTIIIEPEDSSLLLELASQYLSRRDYRQAIMIIEKALIHASDDQQKARANNLLGVAKLNTKQDLVARDLFKKAVSLDHQNHAAGINLAGLYSYYGHADKAFKIYKELPESSVIEVEKQLIHPKAKELYLENMNRIQMAKKGK